MANKAIRHTFLVFHASKDPTVETHQSNSLYPKGKKISKPFEFAHWVNSVTLIRGLSAACMFAAISMIDSLPAFADTPHPEAFYQFNAGGVEARVVVLYTDGTILQSTEDTDSVLKTQLTPDEHQRLRSVLRPLSRQKHIEVFDDKTWTASHIPHFWVWYNPDDKDEFIVTGSGRQPEHINKIQSEACNIEHKNPSVRWKPEMIWFEFEPCEPVKIFADWPSALSPLDTGPRTETFEALKEVSRLLIARRIHFIRDRGKFWYIKSWRSVLPESPLRTDVENRANNYAKNVRLYGNPKTTKATDNNVEKFLRGESDHCRGVDSNRNKKYK